MPPLIRQDPVGDRLKDGYGMLVTLAADPDVSLWETQVQPVGVSGGELIDTTTNHNTTWRTKWPRTLKELTAGSLTASYDPRLYDQLVALINVPTLIDIEFYNGAHLQFYGCMREFAPAAAGEGTFPTANVAFSPTNTDPDTGEEAGPQYISPSGTET